MQKDKKTMEKKSYLVECVDFENYQELANDWNDLFFRVKNAYPYLSFTWVDSFIRAHRIRGTVCIVTVRLGNKLVALWPLSIRKLWRVKIAEPIGTGRPSYLGILMDSHHTAATEAIVKSFCNLNIADVYYTSDLSSKDSATQQLIECLTKNNSISCSIPRNICRYIQLGCSWVEYLWENKTGKSRQTLRRKERKLVESHNVQVEYYLADQITTQILNRIAEIQQESWMKRRGAAVLGQQFYHNLLYEMAQKGFGRVWIMTIDGEDAAFIYGLVAHDNLQYNWTAFKLKYTSYPSVGMVLTMWSIKHSSETGIEKYDFGHGDADYKQFWSNRNHVVNRLIVGHGFKGEIAVHTTNMIWKLFRIKWVSSLYRYLKNKRNYRKNVA
jgi:CelD/BcsL family acetyltransferase involved in cellulose biosynthesis